MRLLVATVVASVLCICSLWLLHAFIGSDLQRLDRWSKYGDAFAMLNTFFSGVALAAVGLTLFAQREELRLQRKEVKMQRDEMHANTVAQHQQHDAMIASARIAALTELLNFIVMRKREASERANSTEARRLLLEISCTEQVLQCDLRRTYKALRPADWADESVALMERWIRPGKP